MKCLLRVVPVIVCLMAGTTLAFGQGGSTSTISGVVVDAGGGVVPGADVVVKHNATGTSQSAVSNSQGAFVFPGLNPGTYTVTVTLQGFKTFVANNVVLTTGAPANVKAKLEVGGLSEQVVVSSTSEIVQTQSSTISNTINTNQIVKLPLTSRSAMDFVTFMPGVSTPSGNRNSTINGLPQGSINITLDGVNIQDNTLKTSDGFFSIVSPRLDAVEEVTVTTAAQGADGAGQGAVQIKFVTRAGTNQYTGSGYHYYRNDALNANTWFNNRDGVEKGALLQNQVGARFGGPVVIPGLFNGRNKAFFFVNYEEFRQPSDTTRTRTLLNPDAQKGIFSYDAGGSTQQVNLLALAAANGQIATMDPTVAALLGDIRSAAGTTGSISTLDPNLDRLRYNLGVTSLRRYPTVRFDYNLTDKHRFTSSFNYQVLHGLARHAERARRLLAGIPGRSGPEFEAPQLQQRGALDAHEQPRERGAGGLERRAGHVLQGNERGHVYGVAGEPEGLPSAIPVRQLVADGRRRDPFAPVAQRDDAPHRRHADVAARIAQLHDRLRVDAERRLAEELVARAADLVSA